MATISRAATRKIADIKKLPLTCKVFSLSNHFAGIECDPAYAWNELARFDFARLRVNDAGTTWTVAVHSNLWYELRAR
jgi:hypothetical protein